MFIMASCSDKVTYRLERATDVIVKRSADDSRDYQYVEFTGKRLVKYNIVNLGEIW